MGLDDPLNLLAKITELIHTFLPLEADLDVDAALGLGLEVEVGRRRPKVERLRDLVVHL